MGRKEHFEEDCPGVDWNDRGFVSGVVDDGFDAGGYNEGRAHSRAGQNILLSANRRFRLEKCL